MFVLITYDVNITSETGAKRLRKVARVCTDYGKRVQNSVFECVVTEAQLVLVKNRINDIIDKSQDSIRFYFLGSNWHNKVETMGKGIGVDVTGTIII